MHVASNANRSRCLWKDRMNDRKAPDSYQGRRSATSRLSTFVSYYGLGGCEERRLGAEKIIPLSQQHPSNIRQTADIARAF
jgi:hypothetical protein